jgi:hypothetical protein
MKYIYVTARQVDDILSVYDVCDFIEVCNEWGYLVRRAEWV